MTKQLTACALSLTLLFSSSCATMLKGTTDNMAIVSDPVGAKVAVNGDEKGTTPVSFTVPSKQDLNIHLSKEGYQAQDVSSEANFRWGYEIWAFLAYVIPLVVDLSDGAAWGHDPTTLTAHLEPIAQPSPAAPAAAASPAASVATANPPVTDAPPATAIPAMQPAN